MSSPIPALRSLCLLGLVLACERTGPDGPARVNEPVPSRAPPQVSADARPPERAAPAPTPAETADASSAADAAAPTSDAATATAAPSAPPQVKVISIGMHVAGGPFDEATKKPFLRAVEPHYPELARCWSHVPTPRQADVGVDLLIPAAGGKAAVSNPRSTLAAEGFLPCVVAFFAGVEFPKPARGGPQGVSYSVRFVP